MGRCPTAHADPVGACLHPQRNLVGKPQNALTCVFNREPRGLSDILAAAKSAAPKG